MSTNINNNILKNFIVKAIGADHLTSNQARKHDIDIDEFNEANVDENNYLELDEILDDKGLYEKFATLYVQDKEEKLAAKDKEEEKEEQRSIKGKNEAGV